jgi:hypothetical protein
MEKNYETGRATVLPHFYIAGICVHAVSLTTLSFLEYAYPYYQSEDYRRSRYYNGQPVAAVRK